jgi:dipeptidase E
MKLYLSSYRIPTPDDLAKLLGKPLDDVTVAVIPNAKDYYSPRAWSFVAHQFVGYLQSLGFKADTVDLREYSDALELKQKLANYDLIWARGGNTYMLRYEMRRSGFDEVIGDLLDDGIVYGGDSAGALVAGTSIAGVELADEPAFAEELIMEGLNLIPFVPMPHIDNPDFAEVMPVVDGLHTNMIKLKDSQAVVFDGDVHWLVEADTPQDMS